MTFFPLFRCLTFHIWIVCLFTRLLSIADACLLFGGPRPPTGRRGQRSSTMCQRKDNSLFFFVFFHDCFLGAKVCFFYQPLTQSRNHALTIYITFTLSLFHSFCSHLLFALSLSLSLFLSLILSLTLSLCVYLTFLFPFFSLK